jgi:hypothetical protein
MGASRRTLVVVILVVLLAPLIWLFMSGPGGPFVCPDLSKIVFRNERLSVYGSQQQSSPCPIVRDPTTFSAGATANNYFYPQTPSENAIVFLSQTDYHDLRRSSTVEVKVEGLAPASPYFFQSTGSNEVHQFWTRPERSSANPFRFAVIGDTQGRYDPFGTARLNKDRLATASFAEANIRKTDRYNKVVEALRHVDQRGWQIRIPSAAGDWKDTIEEVRNAPNYRGLLLTPTIDRLFYSTTLPRPASPFGFVLHVGDVVDDARYPSSWTADMFDQLRYLLTFAPVYPAIGNHEYNDPSFGKYFRIPGTDRDRRAPDSYDYVFEWPPAVFIVLDTNSIWHEIVDIDKLDNALRLRWTDKSWAGLQDIVSPAAIERARPLEGRALSPGQAIESVRALGLSEQESRGIRSAAEVLEPAGENIKIRANAATGRVELGKVRTAEDRERQLAWLDEKLGAYRDRKFIFVASHHPLLYGNYKIEPLSGVLQKHRVTAYFNGHMHNYTHHFDDGVHFFTTGGGGLQENLTPLPPASRPSLMRQSRSTHYLLVEVNRDDVKISALRQDNSLIEEVLIPRRQP